MWIKFSCARLQLVAINAPKVCISHEDLPFLQLSNYDCLSLSSGKCHIQVLSLRQSGADSALSTAYRRLARDCDVIVCRTSSAPKPFYSLVPRAGAVALMNVCCTSLTRGGRPRLIMHALRDCVIAATEQDGCDRYGSRPSHSLKMLKVVRVEKSNVDNNLL